MLLSSTVRSQARSHLLVEPVGEAQQRVDPHADGVLQLAAGGAGLEVEALLGADADHAVVRQHGVRLREELGAVPLVEQQGERTAVVDTEPAVEIEPSLQDFGLLAVEEEVDAAL